MKQPISYTDAEIEQIRNDTGPLGTHFKLDEQAGCKITELKEKNAASGWVDGLPPIGTVCEVSGIKHDLWTKYTILAYHGIHAWGIRDGTVEPANLLLGGCKFRPILTPKQRTIEAAVEATCACTSSVLTDILSQLYDLGHLTLPGEQE